MACVSFFLLISYDMAINVECVWSRFSASFVPVWHGSNANLSPPISSTFLIQPWECQFGVLFIIFLLFLCINPRKKMSFSSVNT